MGICIWDKSGYVVYAKVKFIHFIKDVKVAESLKILEGLIASTNGDYTISKVESYALSIIKAISNP